MIHHPELGRVALPELSPDDFYRADARALFEIVQAELAQPDAVASEDVVRAVEGSWPTTRPGCSAGGSTCRRRTTPCSRASSS